MSLEDTLYDVVRRALGNELKNYVLMPKEVFVSPQPTTGKRYLNTQEAADFLGIKLQTLYQNIGKMPCKRKHGKLHFVESELIEYMEGKQPK